MNESVPMTNKEIRRQAWKTARRKFWPFVGVSLVFGLILTAFMTGSAVLTGFVPVIGAVLMIVFYVFYPALMVGYQQYICNVWHDQPAGIRTLFQHMRRTGRAWGVFFLMFAMMFGIMLPMMIILTISVFLPTEMAAAAAILMFVLVLAIYALLIWLAIRFSLAFISIVLRPAYGVFDCMGASWRATRRNFWRIFRHSLMLALPVLAIMLPLEIIGIILAETASETAIIVIALAAILPMMLFSLYASLGTFGLAEHLLDAACPLPAEEPDPNALPAAEEYEDEYEDADEPEDEEEYEDIPEDEPTDDEPKEDPDTL